MDVDLRLIRYFLAVAEQGNFTAAARRLYVSQPALSSQIRRLEGHLGVRLFERSASGATLTAEGRAFEPYAREALATVQAGVAAAIAAAGGDQLLRIDVLESGLAVPRRVVTTLRSALPRVRLELSSRGTTDQTRRLLAGELDLGLCGAGADLPDGLAQRVVEREPLAVALPAEHRRADDAEVRLGDLCDETHYLPRDDFAPEWNAFVVEACRAAGFEPRRHPASADGTSAAFELVQAGDCVAVSLMSTPPPPGVVVRRLAGAVPDYAWAVRWRARPNPPATLVAALNALA